MMVNTTPGVPIDAEILHNYFRRLVNHFFKILPMRENNEESLTTYMQSLQVELLGCKGLITAILTHFGAGLFLDKQAVFSTATVESVDTFGGTVISGAMLIGVSICFLYTFKNYKHS